MRIRSLDIRNLRLRGGRAAARLDGARDDDTGEAPGAGPEPSDRAPGAQLVRDMRADGPVLQVVFDRATLDHFQVRWLRLLGVPAYPQRHCVPGNDGRGLDLVVRI